MKIKKLKRERNSLIDLSPENTQTLKLASDFDEAVFTETDVEIGLKIRNYEIKLEIAQTRYNELFVGDEEGEKVEE